MAISNNYVPIKQLGNGATADYGAGWPIFAAAYIRVYLESVATGVQVLQVQGTNYSLTFDDSGFVVTFLPGFIPTAANYIVIGRSIALDQTNPYKTSKGFDGSKIEGSYDKLTGMVQDLDNARQRSLVFPLGDTTSTTLPTAAQRAGQALFFDALGAPTVGLPASAIISAAMQPVVAAASLALARIAMGVLGLTGGNTVTGTQDFTGAVVNVATQSARDGTNKSASTAYVDGATRERLSANRTYYVRTDGSDSNTGLANTAGGAFLTIQKAATIVRDKLDLNGFFVTVQVADGTYTAGANLSCPLVGAPSYSGLTFQGNVTTPGNCVINLSGANTLGFNAGGFCQYSIAGFKITGNGSAGISCVNALDGGHIEIVGLMEYGSNTVGYALSVATYGVIRNSGFNATISGSMTRFATLGYGGTIYYTGSTITLTGTPAFSDSFYYGLMVSSGLFYLNTYSGAATGKRYIVNQNSALETGGASTALPGSIAGTTATGGQVS